MKTTFVDRLQPFRGRSLKAFIWVHYNYEKKLLFHIVYCERENHLPQVYLKFILLVISELCLVYHRIFFTAFAYKMNLKKAKNSEVV